MGKTLNRVCLLGNVGRDPEVKFTGGGTLVASFSIATTDRYKDSAGEWKDKTEWSGVAAYGRTAEIVRDYVKKGNKVYVEGKLTTRSWDGNDGKKVYRTEVIAGELILLGGERPQQDQKNVDSEDDIPFLGEARGRGQ
jgi:single-strand DNA-binding protein